MPQYVANFYAPPPPRTYLCQYTHISANHIFQISTFSGQVKKIFWSVIVFGMVVGLLFNLVTITVSFFSYNTDVKIKMKHQTELAFPSVTVCNMNAYRKSAILDSRLVSGTSPDSAEHSSARRRRKRSAGIKGLMIVECCLFR